MRKERVERTKEIAPSASRLTTSLRDIGYEFVTAVADIVDNSVAAGASIVDIRIEPNASEPCVLISDNGSGMRPTTLEEALRFGSRRTYGAADLGKFGLGLKTASLSQCRRVTVLSRSSAERRRISRLVLDLDHVERVDRWEVIEPDLDSVRPSHLHHLNDGPGTVVVWEKLDRALPYANQGGGWARRRLAQLAQRTSDYLAMVFHRFIDGEVVGRDAIKISINGDLIQAWDPFARSEPAHDSLPTLNYSLPTANGMARATVTPHILPTRDEFSSVDAFDRLAGPEKWNRQQGLYVYRANRMIQSGGWSGLRTLDEHTKLARVELDFSPELDDLFQVNVAKARVSIPPELRVQIGEQISEVCRIAGRVYRQSSGSKAGDQRARSPRSDGDAAALVYALRASALALGDHEWAALERIIGHLVDEDPTAAADFGLRSDVRSAE